MCAPHRSPVLHSARRSVPFRSAHARVCCLLALCFLQDGRGGYASALPFNAYGALGMAREEYNVDSASSQFFWLLFDSDLTPAGKNLLDGRYACFGYTVDGARLLSDVKEGDVIVSAKVTSGLNNLVAPSDS